MFFVSFHGCFPWLCQRGNHSFAARFWYHFAGCMSCFAWTNSVSLARQPAVAAFAASLCGAREPRLPRPQGKDIESIEKLMWLLVNMFFCSWLHIKFVLRLISKFVTFWDCTPLLVYSCGISSVVVLNRHLAKELSSSRELHEFTSCFLNWGRAMDQPFYGKPWRSQVQMDHKELFLDGL